MKIFHCDYCEQLVFFENVRCVNCEHDLAYLPDRGVIGALKPAGDNLWDPLCATGESSAYRLCENFTKHNVCNWAIPIDDPNPLCLACRLTRIIPDLDKPGNREAWYRLEVAKRRLVYSLECLGLPVEGTGPDGNLVFEFKADLPGKPVLTGHSHGLITMNIAEANDAEREKRRHSLHEPYRTLLGHFRHEVGHYYWEQLIQDGPHLEAFRARFGDELEDYGEALKRHYKEGPPADWQQHFISAYASSHAWEDWAETWAHYMHITDTLETASACGLRLRPRRSDDPTLKADVAGKGCRPQSFDRMVEQWFPLTYVLNNLNRGMGLPDGYPFVLSTPTLEKLRLVHEVVGDAAITVAAKTAEA